MSCSPRKHTVGGWESCGGSVVPSGVCAGLPFPAVSLQWWGLEKPTACGSQTPSSYRSVALTTREIREIWEILLLAPPYSSNGNLGGKQSAGVCLRLLLSYILCWHCTSVLGMDTPLNPSTKTGEPSGPTIPKVINPPSLQTEANVENRA